MTAPRTVTCATCGRKFETKSSRAKYCPTRPGCRKAASRKAPIAVVPEPRKPTRKRTTKAKNKAKSAEKPAAEETPDLPPAPTYDELAEQVTATLTTMNAYDTIAGKAALRVAQQIDRGRDTGSAVATLSTQLMRLVEQAKLEAAPLNRDPADDVIDAVNNKLMRLMA